MENTNGGKNPDCLSCKESILGYVREIKDDLKEIVREKSDAVIDHLTDLVKQVNKSLDEGSRRMSVLEIQISELHTKINKTIKDHVDGETIRDDNRRTFVYRLIMWAVAILVAHSITISTIISFSHKEMADEPARVERLHMRETTAYVRQIEQLQGQYNSLKYRIEQLEK